MLDIYICEDTPSQLTFIKQQIENFIAFDELDMQVAIATDDPDTIIAKAKSATNCGLYFLDVELGQTGTNGFLLAQTIRTIEPRCYIVFVTSHFELSFYTYQYKVEAMDYIIKNGPDNVRTKLHECMLSAYKRHTGGNDLKKEVFLASLPNGRQISVANDDIISFETSPDTHKIVLLGLHRRLEFADQMNALEERLGDDFVRCHRSIIINVKKIKEVDFKNNQITMCDNSVYPISLRKRSELKKKLKPNIFM